MVISLLNSVRDFESYTKNCWPDGINKEILPILFILLTFYNIAFLGAFVGVLILNGFISGRERGRLREKEPMEAIAYVGTMIKISKKILKLDCEILKDYREDLEKSLEILLRDKRSFKSVNRNNGIEALNLISLAKDAYNEAFGQTTFDVEIAYYKVAKKYKAPFLNLVSSISPEDDVTIGKSYYLAEAEAILRIIKALDKKTPVFCLIDEIFRGTNPIERIAASEEILRYIQGRNSISLVATHDKELTELLKETHDFYHFNEKVSETKGLSFDYKLKEGVLKTGNAIRLLKYVGYPDEIINRAENKVKRVNNY